MQHKKTLNDEQINLKELFSRKHKINFCNLVSKMSLVLSDCIIFILALIISRNFIIPSSIIFYQLGTKNPSENVIISVDWHYALIVACVFYFRVTGHYTRRQTLWDEAQKVLFAICFSAVFDFFMLSISSLAVRPFSEVRIIYFLALLKWGLLFLSLIISRDLVKRLLIKLNIWQKPTVIIGVGDNAKQTYLALTKEKSLGFDVKLFIDISKKKTEEKYEIEDFNIPIVALHNKFNEFFKELNWPHVVIALEEKELKKASNIIDSLSIRPNALDVVPPVRGFALYGLDVSHIFGSEILLLRARNNLARKFPRILKRYFDVIATIFIIIGLSPFLLYFIVSIKKDGGSSIYKHKRVGEKGKPFYCLKFRSMVQNADKLLKEILANDPEAKKEWKKDFKLKNDPRVTKVGKILRRYSLDELPQLVNVLKGEMSLVGPRPIVEDEIKLYGEYAEYYKEVKPGMTGLWQISGRNDIDYSYRVRLDVWYIKNWSFWYDIVILVKTIPAVLKSKGAY